MRNRYKILLAYFIVLIVASPSVAQYTFFTPKGSFAIEVSLENSPYNRLPIYQNSITSLAVVGDNIVGGTSAKSGLSPYIFTASISKKKLVHKKALRKVVSGQQGIKSGFCRRNDHTLYAGSIPDTTDGKSGHLLRVKITGQGEMTVSDIGVPVKGEGIFALTCNSDGGMLYGISYPSGVFFRYDVKTGKATTYAKTATTEHNHRTYHEFALEPENYLSHDLITDNQGRVYGSKPVNKLFYFDPKADSISILQDKLPFVWGRHTLGSVDAWAKSKDGMLYGGNAGDGQLFKLDPSTGKVTNLGKPIMMNRLRGLTFVQGGKLYGIAGALPGYAHLFSYDAGGKGFIDLGNPQFPMVAPGLEQGIMWRGFQLGTIAASEDGRYVVMGEDESLSQLMIFPVNRK